MFAIIVSVIFFVYVPFNMQMSFAVSVFANLFTYIIGKKGEYMVKKKLCVIYNTAPQYREAIFRTIDAEYDCD